MFTDDDRRTLYNALEPTIGHDPAAILMAHLAPVGWVELATKSDIAELRGEMKAQLAKMIVANFAAMIGLAGLILAAISLG
jgi:hypothetical protein